MRLRSVLAGTVACMVSLAGSAPAAAQAQAQAQAQHPAASVSEASRLLTATVQMLSAVRSARARLSVADSQGLPDVLQNTRVAIGRLDATRTQVRELLASPDEAIRSAAMSLEASLGGLINPLVSRVRAMEKLLQANREATEWAALTAEVTRLNARLDEAWRQVPGAVVRVTQALVDESRTVEGRLAYMKLTRAEHTSAGSEVEQQFPAVSESSTGDDPVTVSVRVLQAFMGSGWRAADEGAPTGR